jgi:hypothetical protein
MCQQFLERLSELTMVQLPHKIVEVQHTLRVGWNFLQDLDHLIASIFVGFPKPRQTFLT